MRHSQSVLWAGASDLICSYLFCKARNVHYSIELISVTSSPASEAFANWYLGRGI